MNVNQLPAGQAGQQLSAIAAGLGCGLSCVRPNKFAAGLSI